jgi:hypothetical protein
MTELHSPWRCSASHGRGRFDGEVKATGTCYVLLVYRVMKAHADRLPLLGRAGDRLGVRLPSESKHPDVFPDGEGQVHPEHDGRPCGMSVTLDNPRYAPTNRLPRDLGGTSSLTLFEMSGDAAGPLLEVVQDHGHHAVVRPKRTMSLEQYETGLAETRRSWRQTDVSRIPPLP